jgi:hypothetical protein
MRKRLKALKEKAKQAILAYRWLFHGHKDDAPQPIKKA